MIAYLANDLIWASKIKATADAIGVPARPTRTIEMLAARLADSEVRGLIVDLEAPPAIDMIKHVRARPEGAAHIRVVAFGPHVAKDQLEAARDAGADEVLPRGAMDRNMEQILRALEARG